MTHQKTYPIHYPGKGGTPYVLLEDYKKLERELAARREDAERLDWFEQRASVGGCPSLVYDDNGHWAVEESGLQSLRETDTDELYITHHVAADKFKPTVREAIDAAREKEGK